MSNDYNKMISTMPMELEIILLQDWGGGHYGDIIKVTRGLYNTLINKKIGMEILGYEDVKDKQRLVNNARMYKEEYDEMVKFVNKLEKRNNKLEKKVEVLEKCKDKRCIKKNERIYFEEDEKDWEDYEED